jgi:hypothetical protein
MLILPKPFLWKWFKINQAINIALTKGPVHINAPLKNLVRDSQWIFC